MPRCLSTILVASSAMAATVHAVANTDGALFAELSQREMQNMCPASHSLLSQGLVEVNVFGNVFSITTPADGGTADDTAGGSVETISITTLSLRMADHFPNGRFEVWLYTGSGLDRNANDLDEDPSNDNTIVPSTGDYTGSRAKIGAWELISEGIEGDLIPDTGFYDNSAHFFDLGTSSTGLPIGPLGTLDQFENMEEVAIAAKEWNAGRINSDGGMEVISSEGETISTYFYKIPEEMFPTLKLPIYNGKLTLFVTLDRVGMQSGYAKDEEFDAVDVAKHDYLDQTPSVDGLNGNINLQTRVGESSIFYPWVEQEFFYTTRRFLGKVWYEAEVPCEYTATPTGAPTASNAPTDECDGLTCYNGSTCKFTTGNGYYCDCDALNEGSADTDPKFAGQMCQHESTSLCAVSLVGEFAPNQQFCTNNGVCVQMVSGEEPHPGCICTSGWDGDHCEIASGDGTQPGSPLSSEPSPNPIGDSFDRPSPQPSSPLPLAPSSTPKTSGPSSGQPGPMPSGQFSAQPSLPPVLPDLEGVQGAGSSSFSASRIVRILCGGASLSLFL